MNYLFRVMNRTYRLIFPEPLIMCRELEPFLSEETSPRTPVCGEIAIEIVNKIRMEEQNYLDCPPKPLQEIKLHLNNQFIIYVSQKKSDCYSTKSILQRQNIKVICQPDFFPMLKHSSVLLKRMYLESFFLLNYSFILHSSLIRYQDCTIAFCAPKQTGKSTQASLWRKERGAEILNGDRSGIRIDQDPVHPAKYQITAYGLPHAGSSGIYCNDGAPLKAIILLEKATDNSLERVSPRSAFIRMFSQVNVPRTDELLLNQAISHLEKVVSSVPVYLLKCTPDVRAVRLVEQELFEKEERRFYD